MDVIEETGWPLTVAHYSRERKQHADLLLEALRASELRLQGLLDSPSEGIYGVDLPGICTFDNRACAQMLGFAFPEELLGGDIHERVHHTRGDSSPYPREACHMYQAFREGRPTDVDDELFWRKDGSSFPVHYRSAPIRQGGQVVGAVAVFEDISERRRAAEETRQRSLFAEQLVGIVSHDLRTPLNAILLGTAALERHKGLDAQVAQALARVRSSAKRASRLVHALLDFTQARLGQGIPIERRPVDLHVLAAQAAEEVGLAHPGRRILLTYQGDARGEWDAGRLSQVVDNLLGNALSYSPAEATVEVQTRGDGAEAVLQVHNPGEPIPSELLPQLFSPMKRGSRKAGVGGRSVGLGLFIVEHIMRRHRGRVEVHSSAAEGTTFTVRLPRRAS